MKLKLKKCIFTSENGFVLACIMNENLHNSHARVSDAFIHC